MGEIVIRPGEISRILKGNVGVVLRRANLALQGVERGDVADLGTVPGTWFRFNFGSLDEDAIRGVRRDAETWVLGASFHSLLAMIGLALDRAQDCCSLALRGARGPATPQDVEGHLRDHKRFRKLNFPDKIERLGREFGAEIIPSFNPEIESFRRVRNCLEHDYGVVTDEKYLVDGALELRWRFMEIVGVSATGQTTPLVPEPGMSGAMPGGGVAFGPGTIQVRPAAQQLRRFSKGTSITITRQEFAEICFTTQNWGDQLSAAVQKFVRGQGLPTHEEPSVDGHTTA